MTSSLIFLNHGFFQGEVASTIELLGVSIQGTDRDEHTTERGNRQRHDQGYQRLRQINQNEGSWGFFSLFCLYYLLALFLSI